MTGELWAALLPDRAVVTLGGADRANFLQGLVTNDTRQLAPDRALYAGLLTPQGKLLYDFFLIEDGTRILIDIAADNAADLVRRLTLYKLRAAVDIAGPAGAFAVAALWGEKATPHFGLPLAEGAAGTGAPGLPHHGFVDPRLPALGVRILAPAEGQSVQGALKALGARPAGPDDYIVHRLAHGIADTAEIGGEACYPLEANFEALHGVDFKKGCYVGQELTARMKHRGGLRKRVLPVSGAAKLPAPGTPVMAEDTELGPLIAASGTLGLALLRLDRLAEAGAIRAGEVPLTVSWPAWLPR